MESWRMKNPDRLTLNCEQNAYWCSCSIKSFVIRLIVDGRGYCDRCLFDKQDREYRHLLVLVRGHWFPVVRVRQMIDISLLHDGRRQTRTRRVVVAIVLVFWLHRQRSISCVRQKDLCGWWIDFLQGGGTRAGVPIQRRSIRIRSYSKKFWYLRSILSSNQLDLYLCTAVLGVRRHRLVCRWYQYRRCIGLWCKKGREYERI